MQASADLTSRVRLLGPIDAVGPGGAIHASGSALRRTLLALLALRAPEVVAADWLLEHAWGNEPPDSRLRALRFHVSQLRKELPSPALIETHPGGYRLAVAPEAVDVREMELVARAARAQDLAAAEPLERALRCWRGTPFADAAPCALLDDEAQRLSEVRVSLVDDYYVARLEEGASSEIVADLGRLVVEHPLRESLWASLITAQYRAGRQADALRSFEQLRTVLADTAGLSPSTRLQDLQAQVLAHDPTLASGRGERADARPSGAAATRGRGNLPVLATVRVDTDDRLGAAVDLVRHHRFVTLTGTGGAGKTRMAVEVGWSTIDDFDDGVWMIELAPIAHDDAVPAAVLSMLGVRASQAQTEADTPADLLVDWLRGRDLLLVLDNCEHVLNAVGSLGEVILSRCPSVKVVATSREPLGVAGERVHAVPMLDPEVDAVALFIDRAMAADSAFVAGPHDRSVVADICRRLDGLPLAIELAAARVRSLTPAEILSRLDDRFTILRRGSRPRLGRHETLLATLQWSHQLLDDQERAVFARLSVFAGGFDASAADAVCRDVDTAEREALEILASLVEKSLVVAGRHRNGTRYRLLESLREFADQQLKEAGAAAGTRALHLGHYANAAERADSLFRSARQVEGAAIFAFAWDNLRRAHDWAVQTGDMAAAERLVRATRMYATSVMRREHAEWIDRTIALGDGDDQPSPELFAQGAFWAYMRGDQRRADELLAASLDLLPRLDEPAAALALTFLDPGDDPRVPDPRRLLEETASKMDLDRDWWVLISLADTAPIEDPDAEPVAIARLVDAAERTRVPLLMVAAMLSRGHLALTREPHDARAALRFYEEGSVIARTAGDLVSEGDALRAVALASVALDPPTAAPACRNALIHCYELRYWEPRVWQICASSALVLASAGRSEPAGVLLGNLDAHRRPWGFEHELGYRARTHDLLRPEPQVDQWVARGAAMDRHQIVVYAIDELAALCVTTA